MHHIGNASHTPSEDNFFPSSFKVHHEIFGLLHGNGEHACRESNDCKRSEDLEIGSTKVNDGNHKIGLVRERERVHMKE